MSERYGAMRTALRTAGIMLVFTMVFTAMMSTTYKATSPAIATAQQQEKMRLIDEILPRGSYDNALLDDFIELGPVAELGLSREGRAYRARRAGSPAAVVLDVTAPDGYAGRIHLAVAITAEGGISGVRVTAHAETPGLGDYIDPKKDRNRQNPWIAQFVGESFERVPEARWGVKRDGGDFDYRVGATISARAVTEATGRALSYATTNRAALFDTPSGERLQ